jgi:hypothetical protein
MAQSEHVANFMSFAYATGALRRSRAMLPCATGSDEEQDDPC